jgi:hypothetical protein
MTRETRLVGCAVRLSKAIAWRGMLVFARTPGGEKKSRDAIISRHFIFTKPLLAPILAAGDALCDLYYGYSMEGCVPEGAGSDDWQYPTEVVTSDLEKMLALALGDGYMPGKVIGTSDDTMYDRISFDAAQEWESRWFSTILLGYIEEMGARLEYPPDRTQPARIMHGGRLVGVAMPGSEEHSHSDPHGGSRGAL